ncbi:MAG: hypothetical protein HY299_02600 [Verrucomicrobia bacterium]|nr:hypothetical protein [Verrucomicrobiota bacterium]
MKTLRFLLATLLVMGPSFSPAADAADKPTRVNRTLPKVQPPKTELEFSANPTTQEIFRARVFEEPLVPIGGEPSGEENAALAAALLGYAKRSSPDDFASLTGFLERHPQSPWRAGLLTCLGLNYYNTAYYSRALEAWQDAWALGQKATDAKGKFLADRAVCELAGLYSRLGRMTELEALLKSVEKRTFIGGTSERINIASDSLWMMRNQPGVSFKCGPMALQSILRSDQQLLVSRSTNAFIEIFNSVSTQKGFSLTQVAELSKKVGLYYQMAFRGQVGTRSSASPNKSDNRTRWNASLPFVVPSVVHWKAGHYAALVRQDGERFLVKDPTFGTELWATRQALEAETSGYFLIPPGDLPRGWRSVDTKEGEAIWGKGLTGGNDPDQYACNNHQTASCTGSGCGMGMAVCSVHLMLANLQIRDTPVGYTPPVGPPVYFTVRYNQRDYLQPAAQTDELLGPKWTHDWNEALNFSSGSPKLIVGGGGGRVFSGFNTNTQTYAPNQYDQTLLKRLSANTYELIYPDGSKKLFGPLSGSLGFLLSQVIDPAGNAVTLTYDGDLTLVALTDAIGQVTTISYDHPTNSFLITKVTDPFGRFATFEYDHLAVSKGTLCPGDTNTNHVEYLYHDFLAKITDVLGLESRFLYQPDSATGCLFPPPAPLPPTLYTDIVQLMQTPYGTTFFTLSGGPPGGTNTRIAEISYPDGTKERVEYNQSNTLGIPDTAPSAEIPTGMSPGIGAVLAARNTYLWSRTAMASSGGNYTKAKIYHWLHAENTGLTSGILESTKEPLERRVYFNYAGQYAVTVVGSNNLPTFIGRVLDDGQTQLYTNGYNAFGHLTNSADPLGRTFSYLYATNGIDLLEVRQTRAGNNELLFRATYNTQHLPLTTAGADGQTNTFTYNALGQLLTASNPKGETTTYTYSTDHYLIGVDGPLPGISDRVLASYDFFGRVRVLTGVTGYTVTFDYDVMDRITKITHPDSTFEQLTYTNLDLVTFRDRAGRQTLLEHDNMRQVKKQTDPLGRVTRFEWCRCGQMKSLTDPLGRTTSWLTDVQGRNIAKKYSNGSQVSYVYESASSRLKRIIDEKDQVTEFTWNRDDTVKSMAYGSAAIVTPGVSFTYELNYKRPASMTDGTGTTLYSYNPITGVAALGAGALASVDGPLPNDTITYTYDELCRPVHRAINGVDSAMMFDVAGRLVGVTNALGAFVYGYDGSTAQLVSKSLPNGQSEGRNYGNNLQDLMLQRITHQVGATALSEFLYGHDVAANRIATWSQQAGAQSPDLHTFGYDAANQLLSATVTNGGHLLSTFAYSYDTAANRLTEQVGTSNYTATYNALNEIQTTTTPGTTRTNEWDAEDRLAVVTVGSQRTEFTYDGLSRRVGIRQLVNGSEVSFRRFVWCGGEICEERDAAGAVTKRFFPQGVQITTLNPQPLTLNYYYTRDHLGSIRELTDSSGNVRARYAYDPYGRRTKLTGDMETDFGFAGMFWSTEASLSLALYRAYDPEVGRWLSRDPLPGAEMLQGPNLYPYVLNDPVNYVDPSGLAGFPNTLIPNSCTANPVKCGAALAAIGGGVQLARTYGPALSRAGPAITRFGALFQRAAPAVSQAAQCGQNAATRVPGALEGTVLQLQRVELVVEAPAVRSIAQRIIELGQRFRTTVSQIDFQILREQGFMTDDLYAVETGFAEIVWDLHLLEKISYTQAWQRLALLLEFNPRLWPGQ